MPDATPETVTANQRSAAAAGVINRREPVSERERIFTLDVLRGFAVLGILPMNIQDFSMPGAAYLNPTAYGDLHGSGCSRTCWPTKNS